MAGALGSVGPSRWRQGRPVGPTGAGGARCVPQGAAVSAFTSGFEGRELWPSLWETGLQHPGVYSSKAPSMSEPRFLLSNFLLLILSLLVLHTSFPNSFLLAVFHLP